jgi:putative aldouronate transport system substrate-binding protein
VVLAACSGTTAAPTPTVSKPATGKVKLPSYFPAEGAAVPDLPGTADGVQAGFYTYPKVNPRSVPQPPGKGGDITIMTWNIQAPLVPTSQNPARQEINKQLGANLIIADTPFADYQTRLAAVVAGNDLPDALYLSNTAAIPQLADFLDARCADLTDHLAGDAIKGFPNLAAFPQMSWRGTVFNNRLYAIPLTYPVSLYNLWVHAELLDQTGGQMPVSADDFKRILTQLSKQGNGNVHGMAAQADSAFQVRFGTQPAIFGAANNWALDASGKLTRTIETEAYKASVGFTRDLFAAGAYTPDSGVADGARTKLDFTARKMAFYTDGWSSATQYWDAGLKVTPPGRLHVVPPFAADGKSKPVYWLGPGNFGFVVLKKASTDRIREVLGVLNYFAAPFGSAEHLLINYGLKDVHYYLDDSGNPVATDQGKAQNSNIWIFLARPPLVLFNPNARDYPTLQADEKTELAAGIADPTVGLYSPTDGTKGNLLNKNFYDAVAEIVRGRLPFSDYDGLVSAWRSGGGDKVRDEYQAAIPASRG